MHLRSRICIALLLALVARPAAAQPGIGTCVMGETRNATGGQNGLYGFSITIYQWFEPATCGFCLVSDGAIQLKTVEVQAYNSAPTSKFVGATVSVVGWRGSAECPEPDETVVLIPPQPATFLVPPLGPFEPYTLQAPISASPAFVSPAFLKLEFTPVPTTSTDPAFGQVVAPCTSCRQYITSGLHGVVRADACSGGPIYPWVVRPRGDCVAATETRRSTWGRLKLFYN